MVNRIHVLISFPMGANFIGNIQVDIYRRLIAFIKDLMCFNTQSKCKDCNKNKHCRYYQMTGENFSYFPGLLIENNLFNKKRYKENEQKEFIFSFIGNNVIYKDYISLFFEQLNQNLFGNFFYLNSINVDVYESKPTKKRSLTIITPIDSLNFKLSYNQMVLYYNAKYETCFKLLKESVEPTNIRSVQWSPIKLKTRNIKINGYIYKIQINEELDSTLLKIGVGKYNFLGGGQNEIKT